MLGIRGAKRAFSALVLAAFATAGLAIVAPVAANAVPLPPTNYPDYAVFGEHGVFIGAGSTVNGLVGARANFPFTNNAALGMNGGSSIGTAPAIIADARIGQDVALANNVTVTGTLYYVGPNISTGSGDSFGGGPTQVSLADLNLPPAPIPSAWPAPGPNTYCATNHSPDISKANGQTIQLDQSGGGIYGDVSGGGGTTLEFTVAGDYFLDSLSMGNGSHYKIDNANVRLFVCTSSHVGSANMTPGSLTPDQFYVEVAAFGLSSADDLHNAWRQSGGTFIGNVVVPSAGIHFGSGSCCSAFVGQMLADQVDIEHGVTVTPPTSHEHFKTGMKFFDANSNGIFDAGDTPIADWPIHVYLAGTTTDVAGSPFLTDLNGEWGPATLLNGTYDICEDVGPIPGLVQTFPSKTDGSQDPFPFDIVINTCPGPNVFGYRLTITDNTPTSIEKNDFGNGPPKCREDQASAPLLTRTVIAGAGSGGAGTPGSPKNYQTLQDAWNAARDSQVQQKEVIGMFSKTNENDVLDGSKSIKITQCESAQLTANNANAPVVKITASAPATIVGPDTVGGSIGWELVTGGHTLKSIRANDSTGAGVQIDVGSNGNKVGWNRIDNNGSGIEVKGNSNTLTGGSLTGNTSLGVHIAAGATGNSLSGATITGTTTGDGVDVDGSGNTLTNVTAQSNNGDGIHVTGASNSIVSSTANKNTGDGFDISGGATSATANTVKNDQSNTSSSGGSSENAGAEYRFGGFVKNLSGSSIKADSIVVPKTSPAKCTTMPAANAVSSAAISCE